MLRSTKKISKQYGGQAGFTLMEIVVSTTIFATVVTLLLVLFNYTLKINRKVEQLRQVSQATRNFTEYLVREIRNGSIDYSGTIDAVHCPSSYNNFLNATYLALVTRSGDRECFYLHTDNNLYVVKKSISGMPANPPPERVNPVNVTLDPARFSFFVRPQTNPGQSMSDGRYPGMQPFVTMVMTLSVRYGSGDQPTTIFYQTTASTDDYDIVHH